MSDADGGVQRLGARDEPASAAPRRDGAAQRPADPRPDLVGGRRARPRTARSRSPPARSRRSPAAGSARRRCCAARCASPRRSRSSRSRARGCARRGCRSRTAAWSAVDRRQRRRLAACCAGAARRPSAREARDRAARPLPALAALRDPTSPPTTAVEHKAIGGYEQGRDPDDVAEGARALRLEPGRPMLALSIAGQVLTERLLDEPGPVARGDRGARRRRRRGRAVRLRRAQPRLARSAAPSTGPGYEIQRLVSTREPTARAARGRASRPSTRSYGPRA